MVTQLDPPTTTTMTESSALSSSITNSLNHQMMNTNNNNKDATFSYTSNIMLAAIISLLVVILFVLLLHLYAKWFLAQSRARRSRSSSSSSSSTRTPAAHSQFLGASRFHTFTFDTIFFADSQSKGLDESAIRSIPVFVYNPPEPEQGQDQENQEQDQEHQDCVICLSEFEKNEIGKKLPRCGHAFHVECIDMWLHSHCNCPICRAPVVVSEPARLSETGPSDQLSLVDGAGAGADAGEIVIEIPPGLCKNNGGPSSSSSSSSLTAAQQSLPSTLGCSFKRMLSRSRSVSVECKVHSSSSSTSELVS